MLAPANTFSTRDRDMMSRALSEARSAELAGDFPAGAVLVLDGLTIGVGRSSTLTSSTWRAHAELTLILEHARLLTTNGRGDRNKVELFSSVEPCLMCFGAAVFHRIDRIVYAAPDATTGFSALNLRPTTEWYSRAWPSVESGLLSDESVVLIQRYENQRRHRS